VRLLLDENMSPVLVDLLNDSGIETTHVRDLGMQGGSDEQLLSYAAAHGFVLVSADTEANLDELREPLEAGSIVVLDDYRIRIRTLPIVPHKE
jgi:Domain of unknown function (DUF5615)